MTSLPKAGQPGTDSSMLINHWEAAEVGEKAMEIHIARL